MCFPPKLKAKLDDNSETHHQQTPQTKPGGMSIAILYEVPGAQEQTSQAKDLGKGMGRHRIP